MTLQVHNIHEAHSLRFGVKIRMKEGREYTHTERGWRDEYGVHWLTPGWDYPATIIEQEGR